MRLFRKLIFQILILIFIHRVMWYVIISGCQKNWITQNENSFTSTCIEKNDPLSQNFQRVISKRNQWSFWLLLSLHGCVSIPHFFPCNFFFIFFWWWNPQLSLWLEVESPNFLFFGSIFTSLSFGVACFKSWDEHKMFCQQLAKP